jgi:hypothetical protein
MSIGLIESYEKSCNDFQEGVNFLLSKNYNSKVLLKFKITITNYSDNITQRNLKKLKKQFKRNSILVLFEELNGEKFDIIWKSNKIKQFLILQCDKEYFSKDDKHVAEFIAEFLVASLKSGCLGK